MATGQGYLALLAVRRELVARLNASGVSVGALLSRAASKGLIDAQSSPSAATTSDEHCGAEQFVAGVLKAVLGDTSGERTELFLQLLDEESLHEVSDLVRRKLSEPGLGEETQPCARGSAPPQEPASGSGRPGHHEGVQPKVVPVDEQDSGISREERIDGSQKDESHATLDVNTQHKLVPDGRGGAGFKHLTAGVIIAEPPDLQNLTVRSEAEPPGILETQPHTYTSAASSNPLITGVSSIPMSQNADQVIQNKELRQRVKKMAHKEEHLEKRLQTLKAEKEESQQKLEEKEKELRAVELEKNAQIRDLRRQIEEKKERMEELQQKLSFQEQKNEALEVKHRQEIEALKEKLEKMEAKFNQEKLRLTNEKHKLELKLERMKTNEERMRRQISEEKQRSAELKVEVAEEKQKNTELKAEQKLQDVEQKYKEEMYEVKQKHRDSVSENKKLKEELEIARMRLHSSELEPNQS